LMAKIEERSTLCADRIVAVSEFTREQILRKYPVSAGIIDVIYNGVQLSDQTADAPKIKATRKQFGISHKPVILFVGRANDFRKGLDVLIQAYEVITKKMDAQLIVAGKKDVDFNRPALRSVLDEIIFTGYVNEAILQVLYALCDVYVCPSRLEGFGLTILEAYAAGKPVVATNVGAIPELLEHGKNGALVEPEDPDAMAGEIILFLQNPSLCATIGQANKEFVRNTFSWKKSARQLEKIYEQL